MKKLSLIFALILALGFVGQAGAASLAIKVLSVDGNPYISGVIDPDATSVLIQVDLSTWTFGTDVILGIGKKLSFSPVGTLATVTDWNPTNAGLTNCNAAFDIAGGVFWNVNVPNGQIDATVSNSGCVSSFPLPYKLWQIELQPTGVAGTMTITAETDADQTSPYDYSVAHAAAGCAAPFVEDVSGGDGSLQIIFAKPPCKLVVADPADAFVDDVPVVVDLTYAETGECSPADLSFTMTCTPGPCTGIATIDVNGDVTVLENDGINPVEICVTAADATNDEACTVPGADCTACFTATFEGICTISIYEGGYPVPPLNTFSKPGRRGLALTCGDTVQFDYCEDCLTPSCPVWSISTISGHAPFGTDIEPTTGLLTIGPDCTDLTAPAVLQITVTDPCNAGVSDSVIITVGEVTIGVNDIFAASGAEGIVATVTLENKYHAVKGIQTEIADTANYLTCTSCSPDPDRAPEFICSAIEQADGDCKIVMVSTNPAGLIEEGTGAVATIAYDVNASAPANGCFAVAPTNSILADRFGDQLCVCEEEGQVCFIICGDIYPRECLPNLPNCGDGKVDIFDILEEIDFVLGYAIPSACQLPRADVPTGTPPYCAAPDGNIDILDVLVIIDMALGKANCCDYYYFGKIY